MVGVDVVGLQADAGLPLADRTLMGRGRQGDRGRLVTEADLDPAVAVAEGYVDPLFEAELGLGRSNPFDYFARHGQTPPAADEATYNQAIVAACVAEGIEVIAVTDHYRVKTAAALMKAARDASIIVFPAFEAVTKDGVHFLCLLEQGKKATELERGAGRLRHPRRNRPLSGREVHGRGVPRPGSDQSWGGVCIAAHVAGKGGLLKVLSSPARISAWKAAALTACCLPGPVSDAPQDLRPILENKNAQYRRGQPAAIINASDVGSVADLRKPGASCWVKMAEVSIEGLRQAFLPPRTLRVPGPAHCPQPANRPHCRWRHLGPSTGGHRAGD